jgi:hypothetical protein
MSAASTRSQEPGRTTERRSVAVWSIVGLLVFLGVTALGGSIGMLSGSAALAPPDDWLASIPVIDSWLIPGLVLGLGFGIGSLVTAWGVVRRPPWSWLRPLEHMTLHHWSWMATIILGMGQAVWISLELVYLPEPSALQAVYLPVGLAMTLIPFLPSVRRYLRSTV